MYFNILKKSLKRISDPLGFTLIELLVVVTLIGVAASVVVIAINPSQIFATSRDAIRLEDMNNLTKALVLYLQKNEVFPTDEDETSNNCGGIDTSAVDFDADGKPFIELLQDQGYFGKVPLDPRNTIVAANCGGYHYRYNRYGAGVVGCPASKGNFFVLGVRDMEITGNPHVQSPGFSCNINFASGPLSNVCLGGGVYGVNCYNWQRDMEWVIGKFER